MLGRAAMPNRRWLPVALVLLALCGCSSLDTFSDRRNAVPYFGARRDLHRLRSSDLGAPTTRLLALVDLPLSAVLDTVLLPYTGIAAFLADDDAGGPFWWDSGPSVR